MRDAWRMWTSKSENIMPTRRDQGFDAERLAAEFLLGHGLRLVTSNYLCQLGEIDLIMQHGQTLVFVEVKQRKNSLYGSPFETISYSKQKKLRKTAQHYIMSHAISSHQSMRFDAVGLLGIPPSVHIEWLQNAF